MFRFEHIEHLYAFIGIPILIVLFILMWQVRKRAIAKFGDTTLMARLMPQMSKYKHISKLVLLLLSLSFLIVGWANPQWGTKKEKVKKKSADIFIALDVSTSMYARDISPDRLERAKQFTQKLIQRLKGERLGTIIFAGNAYLQMPLTTDYAAAQLFLKSANPSMAPTQGTAIYEAIDLAERSFEEDNKHHKALIIITDGEDHDEETLQRAKQAHENGLLIFTIGVGTPGGALIPLNIGGRIDHKRDKTGNPVMSKLNEQMLRDLADAGAGEYFNLSNSDGVIDAVQDRIDRIEKREFEQRLFNEYESYFQYFIAFALLLLVIEFLLSYRKSKWLEGKDIFKA